MKKILLLNPPGENYFIRDYYCSQVSKGDYYWPPLDLLVLSGLFRDKFEVCVLDALAQRIDKAGAYSFINKINPDFIICLAGAASWEQDIGFLGELKKINRAAVILSGDYPLAYPKEIIEKYPFVDAILLDFTDSEIELFIRGVRNDSLKNIFTRSDTADPELVSRDNFSIAVPQHSLFTSRLYNLPHIYYHPFATIMTDFGCPYHCTFCSYERIKYKMRDMGNIAEEVDYIISLGIRELWLRDQSFGSAKDHAFDFCSLLENKGRKFSWSCEMRVDAVSEELLNKMAACGCHTIMLGVETASQKVLDMHKKGITLEQTKAAFKIAKKAKVRTLAHFIFGLNGENLLSQEKLIDFCLSLEPDFASFNVANPLWNTTFREEATRNKWLLGEGVSVDASCSFPVWENDILKRSDIWSMRKAALQRFYFRPAYVWRQMRDVKTGYQLRTLIKEGAHLTRDLIFKKQ
ncbi:MAG: radical SAM protein [Candidatus Omnitrophica bacterium]|nr:radical SAM protein [Candidatus Omnitrophota bacterium]MDD5236792.1 radical SAM protein [Candidatus Omnitrophota bacterium]MDD5609971.1 radical SAM protein [Candidatus Omnitrophota bacterium]